jgi:hypothetical protein
MFESLESTMARKRDMHKVVWNKKLTFGAVSSFWYAGEIEPIRCPDGRSTIHGYGQLLKRVRSIDKLPDNFYMRELLDVDTEDSDALARFFSEWGFPLSPMRKMTSFLMETKRYSKGIAQTERLVKAFADDTLKRYGTIPDLLDASTSYKYMSIISTAEAIGSIEAFKRAVQGIFGVIEKTEETLTDEVQGYLFLAREADRVIMPKSDWLENRPFLDFQLGLSSAIANQIIDVAGDDAGWYQCENLDCNRWFKYKRGSKNPINNSIYCSEECQRHMKVLRLADKRRKETKHED